MALLGLCLSRRDAQALLPAVLEGLRGCQLAGRRNVRGEELAAAMLAFARRSDPATPSVPAVVPAASEPGDWGRWVDVTAASKDLGTSTRWIRRLAADGRLRGAVKAGGSWRIPARSVEEVRQERERN